MNVYNLYYVVHDLTKTRQYIADTAADAFAEHTATYPASQPLAVYPLMKVSGEPLTAPFTIDKTILRRMYEHREVMLIEDTSSGCGTDWEVRKL